MVDGAAPVIGEIDTPERLVPRKNDKEQSG